MKRATLLTTSMISIAFILVLTQAGLPDEAQVGQEAPDFTAVDSNGNSHSLSAYKGKIVVLEWLNHGCPFIRKHYDSGNMQKLQETYIKKGMIWFSVISSAPGTQGYCTPEQANELVKQNKAFPTAVLLDPEGTVGRLYGAKVTPHMFILDASGILVYNGGIDDIHSAKIEDIAKAKNYVQNALEELLAGQQVSVTTSQPYGCTVKYK